MKNQFPGSFINFIENILLLKSSYVGSFWFIQTYILLVITSFFVFICVKKHDQRIVVLTSFVLYCLAFIIERKILVLPLSSSLNLLINAIMLYCRSQFSFVIEALFANGTFIDNNVLIQRILNNKIVIFIITIFIVLARGLLFQSMIFAPFSAIIFIILFGNYKYNAYAKNILLYFGKHSTNMWLTHMQYYMIFTPTLVFCSRNVFIIFATLIILSLVSSYIIDYLLDILFKYRNTMLCRKS